jgi:hypothetical protein
MHEVMFQSIAPNKTKQNKTKPKNNQSTHQLSNQSKQNKAKQKQPSLPQNNSEIHRAGGMAQCPRFDLQDHKK